MKNNDRYDLSSRLIHFFRLLDTDDGSAPNLPETWGPASISEHTKFSAIFLLRSAIRNGHLWATWSLRKEIRTIYGKHPAVCFTDMPTAAFIESSRIRKRRGEKMSSFALSFNKSQLFSIGARPVIYGLSDSSVSLPDGTDGKPRVFNPTILPYNEQYRYVTFSPSGTRPVDWSHEREWRWAFVYDDQLLKYQGEIEECGVVSTPKDIPGLNFIDSKLSDIGIIVEGKLDARKIIYDIVTLYDRHQIDMDTFTHIIVTNEIQDPSNIRDKTDEFALIRKSSINLSDYTKIDPDRDAELIQKIRQLEEETKHETFPPTIHRENGGCWLWLLHNYTPLARALINNDLANVNEEGKYLYEPNFNQNLSLSIREAMTESLARKIRKELNENAGFYSVLNSTNFNDAPSYNSDFLDSKLHYNWWSDGLNEDEVDLPS